MGGLGIEDPNRQFSFGLLDLFFLLTVDGYNIDHWLGGGNCDK
jgi:hypothetical protein